MPEIRLLPQILAHWAENKPDRDALIFLSPSSPSLIITYSKLYGSSAVYTDILRKRKIQSGDLVVLAFRHSFELLAAFFGSILCGAVPTIYPYPAVGALPVQYFGRVLELVKWTGARTIITTPSNRETLLTKVNESEVKVLAVKQDQSVDSKADRCKTPVQTAKPEDPAYVQFSSGTTGSPKGVVISHRAVWNHIQALSSEFSFRTDDVSVGWLPFFHDMGLVTQVLLPVAVGGKSVFISPVSWLKRPAALFRAIDDYQGTMCWMPNSAFAYSMKHIHDRELEGMKLDSLRTLGCGGEPIHWDTMHEFKERFSVFGLDPLSIMPGYGMAENVVGITHSSFKTGLKKEWISRDALKKEHTAVETEKDDSDAQAVVSCGVPFQQTEIAVWAENGASLPERRVGEIVVRGNSLFSGYYRQPDSTAQVMRDGWLLTGDLGYVSQGELYVVDRRKDLIIVGGQNIYPHLIEKAAHDVSGTSIRYAAAFGIQEEGLETELPVLVCELMENIGEGEQKELSLKIREAVWKITDVSLADVRFVPRGFIEKTTSGKIARSATRERYLRSGYTPAVADLWKRIFPPDRTPESLEPWLAAVFSSVTGCQAIDIKSNYFEQGVDSLALVQVMLFLEDKFQIPINIEQVVADPTVANLAKLLSHDIDRPASSPTAQAASSTQARRRGGLLQKLLSSKSRADWLHRMLVLKGPFYRSTSLAYSTGHRLLKKLTGSSFIQRKVLFNEVLLLRKCLETIPVTGDKTDIIHLNLLSNSWFNWREVALANDKAFKRWVSISGIENLEATILSGKGVILALTHTRMKYLLLNLPIMKNRGLVVVGNIRDQVPSDADLSIRARGEKFSQAALHTAQVYRARQTLNEGGIAVILADDSEGKGGIRVPFHGRWRPFRPGLGDLAVSTGAAVLPVFSRMKLTGQIEFEFLPPLEHATGSSREQIHHLLRQYAGLLADHWTTDLGNMQWYILKKYLQFPKMKKESDTA